MKTYLVAVVLVGSLVAQTKSSSSGVPEGTQRTTQATSPAPKMDPAMDADIRRLMELAGTVKLATQMMDAMQKNIRPLMVNSFPPGEYREKLIDLFFVKFHSKVGSNQLLDLAVPAYAKYYSHEEIKGLIQFYETPLGQKMVFVQPTLMGDLQEAGRKWGEQLGTDSMLEVLSEHPDLATALKDAKKGTLPPE